MYLSSGSPMGRPLSAAANHFGSIARTARRRLDDLRPAAHNATVRCSPIAVVLGIVLVGVIAACTSGVRPTQSAGQALGAPGCRPASPITRWHSSFPQVEGTGHGVTLWGLLMFPHSMPARVGDQEKIVWRMTGTGSLTLAVIGPDGEHHRLAWGPDAHLGSNWNKPGAEWGAGYVFTAPGCWDLRATRGDATADVWMPVVTR